MSWATSLTFCDFSTKLNPHFHFHTLLESPRTPIITLAGLAVNCSRLVKNYNCFILLFIRLCNADLKVLMLQGIAFHHAGLVLQDRQFIEESFRNGSVPVLLSTNTLAMGVNLPAHLVIVKSTEVSKNSILRCKFPNSYRL